MEVATSGMNEITVGLQVLLIGASSIYAVFTGFKLLNSGRWDEAREGIAKIAVAIAIAVLAIPMVNMLAGLVGA